MGSYNVGNDFHAPLPRGADMSNEETGFAIDVGDIPMPEAPPPDDVADALGYDTAFNFAFVGCGQGGGRLAEQFYRIGYRRVCALNTTIQDLEPLRIPQDSKLTVGTGGAKKDPAVGEAAVSGRDEDLYDLLRRAWGKEVDYAFVCLGAGGGTGSGTFVKTFEVAKKVMEDLKRPVRVGVVVTLPKSDEGQKTAKNALYVMRKLKDLGASPVVVIDNERIKQLVKTTALNPWEAPNKTICSLLNLFNRIAAQDSPITTFDRSDFSDLLDSGLVAFGASPIAKYATQADISQAIRQQLAANVLASTDLKRGTKAGCIFIGGSAVLESIPTEHLDHGFDMLTRILADGSTVHRGVYPGTENDLRAYTLIGGLPFPEARLLELAKIAGVSRTDVASILGV